MAKLQVETQKGTDRPWERPGQLAQNPGDRAPSKSERELDYESANKGTGHSWPAKSAAGGHDATGPVHATNAANENGRVGEPTPLLLVGVIFIPIIIVIGAVGWLMS